jgi:tetratricopeptide (TPR) repeat protein
MSYWKGLGVAAGIDLIWIMGSPAILAPDPTAVTSGYKDEPWALNPGVAEVAYHEPHTSEVDELLEISQRLDSLMLYLQEHPEDVDAIEKVAATYADKGWWDAAIGPLARALQLDPERWSLWSALDRAVENAGLTTISDAELIVKAQEFVEAVEMWGEGC